MNKKKSRKAKPRPDRTQLFLEHLAQYDDPKNLNLNAFPLVLPHEFSLILGHRPIGKVVMDWHALWAKIFDVVAAMAKPDDVSDDEYTEQLKIDFQAMDPKEMGKIVNTISAVVVYMMEYLPEKLNSGILQLSIEARHNLIILEQQRLGSKDIPSPAELADWVGKAERDATKRRLPEIRGGDKKTKPDWKSPDTLKQYAQRVDDRKALVGQIKYVFSDCLEDESWIGDLKVDRTYMTLAQGIPEKILGWAIKRVADANARELEREPQAVACEMARRELGLTFIESTTQQEKYRAGKKLIKQRKRQPSIPRQS